MRAIRTLRSLLVLWRGRENVCCVAVVATEAAASSPLSCLLLSSFSSVRPSVRAIASEQPRCMIRPVATAR